MSSTTGKGIKRDNYPTPVNVVRSLISHITFKTGDRFLEPCIAGGNIYYSIPLPESQKTWAEIRLGVDYLTKDFKTKFDVIGTNPPFSLTCEFLEKSLSELKPDGTLFYLQRLDFLGTVKRFPFWSQVGLPDKVPVIVPRPSFTGGGTDSGEYGWLIYDKGNRFKSIPKGISHIKTGDYLL